MSEDFKKYMDDITDIKLMEQNCWIIWEDGGNLVWERCIGFGKQHEALPHEPNELISFVPVYYSQCMKCLVSPTSDSNFIGIIYVPCPANLNEKDIIRMLGYAYHEYMEDKKKKSEKNDKP